MKTQKGNSKRSSWRQNDQHKNSALKGPRLRKGKSQKLVHPGYHSGDETIRRRGPGAKGLISPPDKDCVCPGRIPRQPRPLVDKRKQNNTKEQPGLKRRPDNLHDNTWRTDSFPQLLLFVSSKHPCGCTVLKYWGFERNFSSTILPVFDYHLLKLCLGWH